MLLLGVCELGNTVVSVRIEHQHMPIALLLILGGAAVFGGALLLLCVYDGCARQAGNGWLDLHDE